MIDWDWLEFKELVLKIGLNVDWTLDGLFIVELVITIDSAADVDDVEEQQAVDGGIEAARGRGGREHNPMVSLVLFNFGEVFINTDEFNWFSSDEIEETHDDDEEVDEMPGSVWIELYGMVEFDEVMFNLLSFISWLSFVSLFNKFVMILPLFPSLLLRWLFEIHSLSILIILLSWLSVVILVVLCVLEVNNGGINKFFPDKLWCGNKPIVSACCVHQADKAVANIFWLLSVNDGQLANCNRSGFVEVPFIKFDGWINGG